ncbi:MAG TPA: hypothetical protein VGK84_02730 [Candidatus Tumulicola sp.]|jgi:hypothetical protein
MAVGAKHPQILHTVVVSNAVDVVDLCGKRLTSPCLDSASGALPFEQACFEQSEF